MELNWFTCLHSQIRKLRPRKVAKSQDPSPSAAHCYLVADTGLKIRTAALCQTLFLFATLLEALCTGKVVGSFGKELFKVETLSSQEEEV